jgi:hypothetical protein
MDSALTENRLAHALGRDRKFVWTGTPARGIRLRASDAIAIPFSLVWSGFALTFAFAVLRSPGPWFIKLFATTFAAVGIYFIVGRFVLDAYFRAHSAYAIGEDAVYIVRDGFAPKTTILAVNALSQIEIRRKADGSGSLLFGPNSALGNSQWTASGERRPSFDGVADVDAVYRLIEHLTAR